MSVADPFDGIERCLAGHMTMKAIIGQQLELCQGHKLLWFADVGAVCAFQGQDDIGFGAGGEIQLALVFANALVPFLAHVVWHHDDRLVAFEQADVGGSDPEIAGAGADHSAVARAQMFEGFVFSQCCVGWPDLHAAAGESSSAEHDNIGSYAGQFLGKDDFFNFVAGIFPVDVEQVAGIQFCCARGVCLLAQFSRQQHWVAHLSIGRARNDRTRHEKFSFTIVWPAGQDSWTQMYCYSINTSVN